ncbi:MAG: succinate dehydrogenase assembly factor 2 [Magnetococcales bacterium]|nr:succinate dehydrogenase assembly factor 2 [Magnetococcales bacterium]
MPGDDLEISAMRRRLSFMARRRAMPEMEQIFDRYLTQHLETMDGDQCLRFLRLLDLPDADLLDWIMEIKPLPADVDRELIAQVAKSRHFSVAGV